MHTNPRPATIATALTGVALALLGIGAARAEAVLAGGALLTAVAWGRARTRDDVARARFAGFEMVWRESSRRARLGVGGSRTFVAELRNRCDRVVHVDGLTAVASEGIRAVVRPTELDVLPGGRARVEIEVTGRRVGRHGLHGLALGASGVGAAFDVPLTFANVLGIEVVPRAVASGLVSPRGGRMRADPAPGRARSRLGDGTELREVREIVPGDSFRKIAWKPSARRGKLMVREMDVDERDVVWIVLDVSPEGWDGPVGEAPLDRAVETAAAFAIERARHGAAIGVALVTDRIVEWSAPTRGGADIDRLSTIWLAASEACDDDRCALAPDELLRLVLSHATPLDPNGLADLPRGDVDRLLSRLDSLRARAPFQLPSPRSRGPNGARERIVRHYAQSFGLDVAARATGPASVSGIAEALGRIAAERPRATDVVIFSRVPATVDDALRDLGLRLRRRGTRVRWTPIDRRLGVAAPPPSTDDLAPAIARHAFEIESAVAERDARARFAAAGIRFADARSLRWDTLGVPPNLVRHG
jgi:uncharacterized protein (DUF58 family)